MTLYRRHTSKCTQNRPRQERTYESDELRRSFKKCVCPIQAEGTLRIAGFTRKTTGETDWEAAKAVADAWVAAGIPDATNAVVPPVAADLELTSPVLIPIELAATEFLADVDARKLDESTRRKYVTMLQQLRSFADAQGFRFLKQFDVATVTAFRATWKDGIRSGAKKLERVKMFFRFAAERKWIEEDPAKSLKPPVGASKPAHKHPFTDAELNRIYTACDSYRGRKWGNGIASGYIDGNTIKTFVMLMVYTGLRISDAATFSRDKLYGNDAFLFMHKTGEPVSTWIPDELVNRLDALPTVRGKYYFLGPLTDRKETAADLWRRRLNEVFALAGEWKVTPTPHRFRHTFARMLLERGVRPADVAELMGDTEEVVLKHYARWVPERQNRLRDVLRTALAPVQRSDRVMVMKRKWQSER